jgi:hypothetical protein
MMTETDPAPPAPTAERQASGRRRPPWWVWLIAAVAAAAVAIILLLPGDKEPSPRPRFDAGVGALNPQVAELVALLEAGEEEQFHARYRATAAPGAPEAGTVTIELWRSPPRVRQDVVVTVDSETATSSAFLLPEGGIGCTREGEGAWTCTGIPGDQTAATDSLARQVTSQVGEGPVTVRDARVAGVDVRCFSLPVSGATAEVCVTDKGVPALISSEGSRIELVDLTSEVAAAVFTPPVGEV